MARKIRPKHRNVADVEAELGEDPGKADQEEGDSGEGAEEVCPAEGTWWADALANQRHERQRQRDRHPGSRQRIDRAGVEVRLVDHPGEPDRGAEDRRNRGRKRGGRVARRAAAIAARAMATIEKG